MSIRIGILGYGNLGRGVESAIAHNEDMELVGVFTRRNPENVKVRTAGVKVLEASELEHMQDQIDVLVLCGGSATDLPVQTPKYAADYNVVDSFDTHAKNPGAFRGTLTLRQKKAEQSALFPAGWDPGMFSLNRLYGKLHSAGRTGLYLLGQGRQSGSFRCGSPDCGRKGRQTVHHSGTGEHVDAVRSGKNPELTTRQKHTRECFVVARRGRRSCKRSKKRSRPCRTILQTMIQPYTSFLRKR